jgi:hypothetical protein
MEMFQQGELQTLITEAVAKNSTEDNNAV